jgi:hypothetical protein
MTASVASSLPLPPVVTIALDFLREPDSNPNRMDADQFALLVRGISKLGFLQPLLVRPDPDVSGRFIIVDGVHRARAARQAGLTDVSCVVAGNLDEAHAVLAQIGMNRLRGSLDLAQVADSAAHLATMGLDLEELTLSGFTTRELDDLLRATNQPDSPDLLGQPGGSAPETSAPGATVERPFGLELTFKTKADLDRVRKSLRKAAGKNTRGAKHAVAHLSDGLLRLVEGA